MNKVAQTTQENKVDLTNVSALVRRSDEMILQITYTEQRDHMVAINGKTNGEASMTGKCSTSTVARTYSTVKSNGRTVEFVIDSELAKAYYVALISSGGRMSKLNNCEWAVYA